LIGCDVLRNETEQLVTELGVSVCCTWIEWGLHDDPDNMRERIAMELARLPNPPDCEAVLLQYGLCCNGTVGLAATAVPMVMPRCHDCIALFLGSARRYRDEHAREPGTYWFTRAFLHRDGNASTDDLLQAPVPGSQARTGADVGSRMSYEEMVEKYGEENAAFLRETWIDAWKKNYTRAGFIPSAYPEVETDRERVRQTATARLTATLSSCNRTPRE